MRKVCTWLIQSLVRGETKDRLIAACAENKKPCFAVPVVPFSDALPDDMPEIDGPFVFYGYTTLILNAAKDERWSNGIFYDPKLFRPSVYLEKWGKQRIFNSDAKFTTIGDFGQSNQDHASEWFIKPNDELKRFTGGVMTFGNYLNWYSDIGDLDGEGDISVDTEIVVCPPHEMRAEWRLFIVDGKIIAKSAYSPVGDLPLLPELEKFAINAVECWSPAAAFVLDVTVDEHDQPKIIEANCINGSGLYHANANDFVRQLSLYQELMFDK